MSCVSGGRPKKKRRGPEPEIADSEGDSVGCRSLSVNSKWEYKKTRKEDSPHQLKFH